MPSDVEACFDVRPLNDEKSASGAGNTLTTWFLLPSGQRKVLLNHGPQNDMHVKNNEACISQLLFSVYKLPPSPKTSGYAFCTRSADPLGLEQETLETWRIP